MTDEADEFTLVDCEVNAIKNSVRPVGWGVWNTLNHEEGIAVD